MLYKAYSSLPARMCPHRVGKEMQRFFGKLSETKSSEAFLMGRKNIQNALMFDKWNKLGGGGRCISNRRYFSEDHPIPSMRKQFMDTLPTIIQDFVDDPKYKDIPEAVVCFKDTLQRLLPDVKDNVSICVVHSYKSMEDPKNITPENTKLVNILAWCFHMVLTSLIVIDDIVDGAEDRLGKKCWHKNEDVGSRAIVDGVLLDIYMYQMLKKYFSHLPMYVPTVRLFHDMCLKLVVSFYLDGIPLDASKRLTISHSTRKRFQTVTTYKNSPLALELPYRLARCLSNKFQTEISSQTREILIKLGEFLQVQNDFRDCYDEVYMSNKTANDIEEGKLTWLITVALEKANPGQRRLLEAHYGKKDPESVNIVKELYNVLEIPKAYANYEKDAFGFIEKNIEQVSKITCLELMLKPLDKLYQPYV